MTRWTTALAAALILVATGLAGSAVAGVGCVGQAIPACGGAPGDALCGAGQDCVSVNDICQCVPATPTATSTATASATPTQTRIADGGTCDTPGQCASDFCVDGVCCDSACDGPAESCNQAGRTGTCVPLPAPAPPLSRRGLFSVIALLTAFGVLSFSRRRRFGAAATHG